MSIGPGDKAKLVTATDLFLADGTNLRPSNSIELGIGKAPRSGNICGGIAVFSTSYDHLDLKPTKDVSAEEINALQRRIQEEYQSMSGAPEMWCKQINGKGHEWAFDRMLQLFDQLKTNAYFTIVCAQLKIYRRVSRASILRHRSQPRKIFDTALRAIQLLNMGYTYDPWSGTNRRGRIGPREGK